MGGAEERKKNEINDESYYTYRPSYAVAVRAPTASTCTPGTRHGLVGSGRCCQACPASASCIFCLFDHITELACYA